MITILTGSNGFLLRAELRGLVSSFVAERDDLALERLDGEEANFERMQEALQSLPFLADKKMVVLQSPGANREFAENAAGLLTELPETTDLIIVEPKLDKRSVYYKFLKKQKGFQEFNELDERGLAQWLVGWAKEKGAVLSTSDALYLVGRVGANQQALASEIEKLSLRVSVASGASDGGKAGQAGKPPKIDRAAIDELTAQTPQSTIFQLLEAAFAGNTRRALELYGEQRALKVEPQQIIAMLAWQLHVLVLLKTAGQDKDKGKTPDEVARDAKMSPYVVRKSAGIARSLTLAQTKRLIRDLLTIDARLKREALNPDDALLHYLMTISE